MFQQTEPAEQRPPNVTHCACCGHPLKMIWWDPRHPKMQAAWQIECETPGCKLLGVTTTDVSYDLTIALWLE